MSDTDAAPPAGEAQAKKARVVCAVAGKELKRRDAVPRAAAAESAEEGRGRATARPTCGFDLPASR